MPPENIFFITNKENFFNVFNQIKDITPSFKQDQILVEPASLNTAPAVTYAIKHLAEKKKIDLAAPLIFLPSDHYIGDKEIYEKVVATAMQKVGDNIGTIGITPTKPEIGYGYIRKGKAEDGYCEVLEFKEKPDVKQAEEYISSGQYLWNSGMYIFNIRTFASELRRHAPALYSLLIQNFDKFLKNFHSLSPISIDYAISEKSDKVIVFEGNFGWSDIGSFDSLADILEEKQTSRHININSKNIFIHSATDRLVATLGVEDLIIVENNDSILIQKRGLGEEVKKIVNHLKENKIKELDHNLIVHRPWGKYEVLIENPFHKVKKITVYPGAKLSLQLHYHRVEHWIVVKGLARITRGKETVFLKENESTFIPTLTNHRLENIGKINLEIIEVQTGNYLEEDDIIRHQDEYDRE